MGVLEDGATSLSTPGLLLGTIANVGKAGNKENEGAGTLERGKSTPGSLSGTLERGKSPASSLAGTLERGAIGARNSLGGTLERKGLEKSNSFFFN